MTTISKVVYLGNNDEEYCGFTVGKEYISCSYNNECNHIEVIDDIGTCRHINNGELHKFTILSEDDLLTETGCNSIDNTIPSLKFFINGYNVSPEDFDGVRSAVANLDEDGVKCDTIKFEVKFE